MAWGVSSATRRVRMDRNDRYISYLPLAHVAERMLIEQASLRFGGQVFFAEALDTFVQDLQRARLGEIPAWRAFQDATDQTRSAIAPATDRPASSQENTERTRS